MRPNLHAALFMLFVIVSSCTLKPDKKAEEKEPDSSLLLGAGFGITNATLIVQNLDSARSYYTKVLGFHMSKPDTSQKEIYDGTRSASVNFPDWSSIVLLSVKDTGQAAAKHPFITSFWQHNEGVRLYSLSTSSADTTLSWLHSQKFKTDSIQYGR